VPDAGEASRIEAWLRRLPPRFLAIHPGSGSRGKNWPKERFWAAAARLSSAEPWLACLGPAEQDWQAPEGAVVARDLPPRDLGALLSHSGVFIGNDSGAAHLAAAWGAATLAIFGTTDPRQWAPVGPRVAVRRAPAGRLGDLDVDAVVEAAVGVREG
jgi:ADP-heptose:LPS heptosyltransferase